ncbi:aminopeptidase n [Plakobranchus ocellatus]|uniref:Aminopeptidase n n=1 Tax=Plakobranchus ocellatus TaxID=259542 RepID=A0AAV4BLK7_9GAST|nr:aminopeptidase n [Plakobranchus ocellatus]
MMVVPDFSFKAMENWGLIMFRENCMLYKPGVSSAVDKQLVSLVVSHELAHQWFGNLLTPAWWDDLWLNEGFATYMMYNGMDHTNPDWHVFDFFALDNVQAAFSMDSLKSSHPIYILGASIIRMMKHFLGEKTFRRGLKRYLSGRRYGVATHNDLWAALTQQARRDGKTNMDIKSIMDTWILQMNYPLITVTQDSQIPFRLSFRQERYLTDPNATDPGKHKSPYNYFWTVPLTFTSSKTLKFNHTDADITWLTKDHYSIEILSNDLPETGGWILANVQQYGYYRVNYQLSNWDALARQLVENKEAIPAINRAQIIDDAMSLARSGHLTMETALKTLKYINNETSYIVWKAASSHLNYLSGMLSLTPAFGAFQSFVKDKLAQPLETLGMTNAGSSHSDIRLLVSLACSYGVETCETRAQSEFSQWMVNPSRNLIDVEFKETFYCTAIRKCGWEEWQFAMKMYKQSDVTSEQQSLLRALGCSELPWILNYCLQVITRKNGPIRLQDASTVINSMTAGSINAKNLVWRLFKTNFDLFYNEFTKLMSGWSKLIESLTATFNTELDYQELQQLVVSKADSIGAGVKALRDAMQKTRTNIQWKSKNYQAIVDFLEGEGCAVPAV